MANAQLDQFVHALWWKGVPVIFLAGVVGLILREVVEWLGRCIGRALRSGRDRSRVTASSNLTSETRDDTAPHCPSCNQTMVRRRARRGANAGSDFWGCT